jgi:hypothetical protein
MNRPGELKNVTMAKALDDKKDEMVEGKKRI